ncbi:MAG: DNA mismatch repair protein [Clostridia bacterium]|nr:DNA mismatch repair protein [Clostridia bacterium]
MKHESLSILFPRQDEVTYRELPDAAWHDLGLDSVVEKIAEQPQEIPLIRRVMTAMTDDPAVSAYRCDVFEDILNHPEIRDRMMKLLENVKSFYDYGIVKRGTGDEAGLWDLMHRLEEYRSYVITVEALRECLSDRDLHSEGLRHLLEAINRIYQENGFSALRKDVEEMSSSASELKSITVGINLNERFEAVSMGLISVNRKYFTRSGLLKNFINAVSPGDNLQAEAEWNNSMSWYPANADSGILAGIGQIAEKTVMMRNPIAALSMARVAGADGLAGVPYQMDSAASMLASRIARRLKEMLEKYLNVSVKEISDLIPELLYYTRWAEYIEKTRREGWTFCKPEILPAGSGAAEMHAEGIYNLKLIGTLPPSQVIPNDLSFDAEKRVYILTGANRGGKTTVTQAIGQLFILAQGGIFVPGTRLALSPADLVLTHFPADEDKTLDLGRLGEECKRFRDLFGSASGNSVLLLNETFSTTSFEEGYFIAVDAVKAILDRGTRTIYNTHMHKLASDLDRAINSPERAGKAVSLVAETTGGQNSFRVRIAPPEGKSFARNIAEKYGVTYESLKTLQAAPEEAAP